jgi:drug/metabolite transporter (DMT)-like permease
MPRDAQLPPAIADRRLIPRTRLASAVAERGKLAGTNLLLLVFLGAIWGTAFMFITMGLGTGAAPRPFYHAPVLFAAFRFDIAGLAVLGIALWRRADLRPKGTKQWVAIGIASVLNVGAYHAFLFWGQRFTSEAVASVLVGLNPLITTLLSRWLLSDERVGWGGLVGLALAFAGVASLALLKGGSLLDAQGVGELAVIGAVASWSLGSILVRRQKHGMDVFAFTAWQMLVGAVLLHLSSLGLEGTPRIAWDGEALLALLYLALVSSAFGFVVYFTVMERVGPIRSNLVSNIAPIFAALAGFVVLHDRVELRAFVAFALIVSGFFLVARPAPAPRSVEPAP